MTSSVVELQSLYELVLSNRKEMDREFGYAEVSREQEFLEEFGSEKKFLKNLGLQKGEKQE